MMKVSAKDRFRRKMTGFGKKNTLCRVLAIPVVTVGMLFFHGAAYLGNNAKRLALLAMIFPIFAVYSSFSFPIFGNGDLGGNGLNPISEDARDIVLAEEINVDLEQIGRMEETNLPAFSDLPEDMVFLETHGDYYELYDASEILEAAQERNLDESPDTDEPQGDPVFSRDDWRLILVNKQHSIPDDYEFTTGAIKTMKGTQYCDERIIDDLLRMLQAAQNDNISLQVCSPYRTMEYQQMLFNNHIKEYMRKGLSYMEAFQLSSVAVNVPGSSEHQIGLALDIVTPSYKRLVEGFADTDAGKWLAENCYKYGFILRYPKGKEYITGIEFEPWHFRYVGVDAATVITERGITLEEFWEEL